MNIVFFHHNGIMPNYGGISRITDVLGKMFRSKGNCVWYIGARRTRDDIVYDANQVFLPSEVLQSERNIIFFSEFVKEHDIDVVVNQAALSGTSSKFLSACRSRSPFLLVSCFHNSVLTPILNGAYQKEFFLKSHHLGFLFSVLRTKFVTRMATLLYILKHRKHYSDTVDESDLVFVLCEGQKLELERMCRRSIDAGKIRVVPGCSDISKPTSIPDAHSVLWVGTFDISVKRPDLMLKAWSIIEPEAPDWKLVMVGDGPAFDEMKSYSRKLGLSNVSFAGRTDSYPYYLDASIIGITSVHESFSMSLVEAMSKGVVPVVFNSFTAASFIVHDGFDGVLVAPFDIVAFSKAVINCISNAEARKEMARNAILSVERFSLDNTYNRWMELLREGLSN